MSDATQPVGQRMRLDLEYPPNCCQTCGSHVTAAYRRGRGRNVGGRMVVGACPRCSEVYGFKDGADYREGFDDE